MSETPFKIQLATPNDAAEITALVNAAYSKWIPIIGGKPMPMTANYAELIAKDYVYVVREGAALIGVLVIWELDDALYIDNIAVAPEQQGRGIGDRMLAFAEEKAREMNLRTMTLLTNAKMESNQAYYRKHGYVETRRQTIAEGRVAVWMHKPLTDE